MEKSSRGTRKRECLTPTQIKLIGLFFAESCHTTSRPRALLLPQKYLRVTVGDQNTYSLFEEASLPTGWRMKRERRMAAIAILTDYFLRQINGK